MRVRAPFHLVADYFGDDVCYSEHAHYQSDTSCITTIAAAIAQANAGGTTTNATGVDMNSKNASRIDAALALAQAADVVVLALGMDKSVEHEGVDRRDLSLPGLQETFALKILALNKPVVLVLTNGGPLAIDNLVEGADAIVEVCTMALVFTRLFMRLCTYAISLVHLHTHPTPTQAPRV